MTRDNAIEKSLFDKTVESIVYNPNLVINEYSKNIKDKIIDLLLKNNRVDIAVSYSVWSGLSLIYDYLKKFNSDSRIIVTIEGLVTDPQSLRKLCELDMSAKVYAPMKDGRGFHLKTYLFENGENRTLLIGSSNISSRAFGLVHEMAVEIDANQKGYIVEEYNTVFNDLWNDEFSEILTKDYADKYSIVYQDKQSSDKKLSDIMLNRDVLKPNYMQKMALIELEECRKTSDRGLVIAATGTGKTYLSAFDIESTRAKKVLFLVHNRLILNDAMKSYKKVFSNSTIIELNSSNKHEIADADFVFTTDKTAFNVLYNVVEANHFDYIVYDEAHKIGEETKYRQLIEYFEPKFTLGITATPERTTDPKYLFEVFKYNVPYEIRLLDAMNYELICPFTYYGFNLDEKLLNSNEEFDYVKLGLYLKDLIMTKGHHGEKLKGIVFCKDRDEAIKINNELNLIGFISRTAVSGKGEASRELIEEYIESLKSDEINSVELICVVNKFNEGIDIPDINTIIMLRNTSSSIIYLQQLGRGLRKTFDPNKYVTIIDIIGNANNNYSIAEVLTGNTTTDKRKLYAHANSQFITVSPFINVDIEKKAMDKIIKSISNNFTVKTRLREKYRNELYRFKIIPSLKELYLNENFKELELLQLLYKNFYDPFDEYYEHKYGIKKGNAFVSNFFKLISQFIFRAYSKEDLIEYTKVFKGGSTSNHKLIRVLCRREVKDGISTAIYSDYYKETKNNPTVFVLDKNLVTLHPEILNKLKSERAYGLFLEHVELIEYLSENHTYSMELFDLVDKGEFLFNTNSKDCYINARGERIDHTTKSVYCPIKITKGESPYDNMIVGSDLVLYHTQSSATKKKALDKDHELIEKGYNFFICAQFPHLGYSSSSYFNLGPVVVYNVSEVKKTKKGKYNHEITFKLKMKIPLEFLQYTE